MLQWEAETGQDYSAEDWLDMLFNMHKSTIEVKVLVKLYTRWYYNGPRSHCSLYYWVTYYSYLPYVSTFGMSPPPTKI